MWWCWFEYDAVAVLFEHYQEDNASDAGVADDFPRARAWGSHTAENDRRDVS